MADRRATWNKFKKEYPQFEENRKFKTDLGPTLDKVDGLAEKFEDLVSQVKKLGAEYEGQIKDMKTAAKAYKVIVDELAASNKKISSDFESMFDIWFTTNAIPVDMVASAVTDASKQIKAVRW
jgi:DNA repair exonuclease SbcCD ATPase subunit